MAQGNTSQEGTPFSTARQADAGGFVAATRAPSTAAYEYDNEKNEPEDIFSPNFDSNPLPGVHLADPLSLPYIIEPDPEDLPKSTTPPKAPSILRTIIEFAMALVIALVLTWAIKTYLVEPFEVPTGSMETTIRIGDKLLADKFTINFNPVERGDIVVFADKVQPGRILVKRVVATGGQVVDIKNGLVFVDGNPLFEPYTNGAATAPLAQHFDNMNIEYPYTVPEGELWVMGDNRENSADSRYFGTVLVSSVYGRALMVFWPFDDIGPL
jgi:signal peptidase I